MINLKGFWTLGVFAALALAPVGSPLLAQSAPFSEGTYVLEGGSYSIDIRREGDRLVVVEPNKTSPYIRQPDGTYHFYNTNTETNYGIRIVDNQTIEAFKPDQPGAAPSRLLRRGGPPTAAAPGRAQAPPASGGAGGNAGAIAERYRKLSETDNKDAQAWTACAAAAKKRELATVAEADAYGRQMAMVLKQIMVDPSRSPCEDAIPASVWNSAGEVDDAGASVAISEDRFKEADRQRLEELNRRADARAEEAKAAALRAEQERQAYERRVAEVKAAEEKFARDKAAHEAALAAARAAQAEYQRKLEEHRRLLASGNYTKPN